MNGRKKYLVIVVLVAVLAAIPVVGVLTHAEAATIKPGIYVRQAEDGRLISFPSLLVDENGDMFQFSHDAASSNLGLGTYEIEGKQLTGKIGGGTHYYVFNILDDETLELDTARSNVEIEYNGKELIPTTDPTVKFVYSEHYTEKWAS